MMCKSEKTPEEHETIRKLKDPLLLVSASGATHTTEEAISICL